MFKNFVLVLVSVEDFHTKDEDVVFMDPHNIKILSESTFMFFILCFYFPFQKLWLSHRVVLALAIMSSLKRADLNVKVF